ncbi:MAG: hypothetical protein K0S53_373 [Bacteroidetes bacterium]|jgi:hypothetical protein|nr:hypothetical protein [Bacteroidota bacterium]
MKVTKKTKTGAGIAILPIKFNIDKDMIIECIGFLTVMQRPVNKTTIKNHLVETISKHGVIGGFGSGSLLAAHTEDDEFYTVKEAATVVAKKLYPDFFKVYN